MNLLKKNNIQNGNTLQKFQLIKYSALIVISILLAKSGLGITRIGQFEIAMLIVGTFSLPAINIIPKLSLIFSKKETSDQLKIIVFNSFVLLSFLAILASAIFFLSYNAISNSLLNGNEVPMPLLLGLYILFNSPSLLIEYIYLINNQPQKILIYSIIIFTFQIFAVGLPPYFGFGLNSILLGLLSYSIVKFCWLIVVMIRYSKIKPDRSILKKIMNRGIHLVLPALLNSSAIYVAGFIVASRFTPDDLAVFQYGARELPLALLLAYSLSMAMLPQLAQHNIESPLAEFRSEVYRLHWILFPLSIILVLTSHWFFPLVFNPQFAASATIFNITLLLVISRVLFPQTILIAKKNNRIIVWALFFEICVNVGFSLWLAGLVGIKGVAYGTFIAYLFEKVFLMIACQRILKISPVKYLPLKIYFISSTLLIFTFVLTEFIFF